MMLDPGKLGHLLANYFFRFTTGHVDDNNDIQEGILSRLALLGPVLFCSSDASPSHWS
jgi:hypothetical protein